MLVSLVFFGGLAGFVRWLLGKPLSKAIAAIAAAILYLGIGIGWSMLVEMEKHKINPVELTRQIQISWNTAAVAAIATFSALTFGKEKKEDSKNPE